MAKYLRPETLFGNKFEGYLNEIDTDADFKDKLQGKVQKETFVPRYHRDYVPPNYDYNPLEED